MTPLVGNQSRGWPDSRIPALRLHVDGGEDAVEHHHNCARTGNALARPEPACGLLATRTGVHGGHGRGGSEEGFHGGRELNPDSHGGGGGSVSSSASSNAGTGRRKGVGGRRWRSWRGTLQRRSSGPAGSLVGRQPWRSASVCARARAERENERGGELWAREERELGLMQLGAVACTRASARPRGTWLLPVVGQ